MEAEYNALIQADADAEVSALDLPQVPTKPIQLEKETEPIVDTSTVTEEVGPVLLA